MYPSPDTDQIAADVAREFLDCELEVNYDETSTSLLRWRGKSWSP